MRNCFPLDDRACVLCYIAFIFILITTACTAEPEPSKIESTATPLSPTTEIVEPTVDTENDTENETENTATLNITPTEDPVEPSASPTAEPTSTSVIIEAEENKGVLVGRAISLETTMPLTETFVMLADVYREGDGGAYALDVAHSPFTETDLEGNFVFSNLEPAEYVIVIGDVYKEYAISTDPSTGKAATWTIKANEVLEVGDLEVELTYHE